jgi:tetratricopeptide (TPR) repeat protein
MPDAPDIELPEAVASTGARWRAAFAAVRHDAVDVGEALEHALASADSPEVHEHARTLLAELAREGQLAVDHIRGLLAQVDALRQEWMAAHRFTEPGIAAVTAELSTRLEDNPAAGARAWLVAILDAAEAGETAATVAIARAELPWPGDLAAGAASLRGTFERWSEGSRAPDPAVIEELAARRLPGWEDTLTPEVQSRAHRFAAWAALRASGDVETARRNIEDAVELYPYGGRMHAERAGFHLFVGDFERAATDAQHAIDTGPREPLGHLMLGIWAELTGKFKGADQLYRRGFRRMPISDVARIHKRLALIDPPGRMLKMAAAVLLDAHRAPDALELAGEALLSGVRGMEANPEAEVYVLRRAAFEQLPDPPRRKAAEAAMQAGRLCIWNGDVDCAIDELRRAIELDAPTEAGWLLADALLMKSLPLGARAPDQALVAEARSLWDSWAEQVGLPSGATSWAYVTRAIVADLASQQPDADRRGGLFEALLYVEKALIRNHTDAQRWGYAAQFLRYVGLEQLAFEADEAGYRLASGDRQVLAERLPLLANRREFEEASLLADRIVTMYGEDPWVSAVRAWLAIHHAHDWSGALRLLELPLAEGTDQAWYREMEALAYLGLERVDDAREAYRKLRDVTPIDGNTKCRLARAALALDNRADARRWLDDARRDPTTPATSWAMTAALQALADEDLEGASARLDEAIRHATSAVEVDDIVFETVLAMRVLDGGTPGPHRMDEVSAGVRDAITQQKLWLEGHPPTPDGELEAAVAAVEGRPLDVQATALLAMAARREAAAGNVAQAVQRYEQLQGSPLEPEATIALERELQVLSHR